MKNDLHRRLLELDVLCKNPCIENATNEMKKLSSHLREIGTALRHLQEPNDYGRPTISENSERYADAIFGMGAKIYCMAKDLERLDANKIAPNLEVKQGDES